MEERKCFFFLPLQRVPPAAAIAAGPASRASMEAQQEQQCERLFLLAMLGKNSSIAKIFTHSICSLDISEEQSKGKD